MYKYEEIADTLKERIVNGDYPEGAVMPKLENLAHEFHTSRITVRKAVQRLIDEGLVYTQRGSGTFVDAHLKQDEPVDSALASMLGTSHQRTKPVTSRVLRFDVRFPTANEQQLLQVAENEPVYDIKRIRLAEDHAVSIESSVMPFSLIPGITRDTLARSVYDYIRNELSLTIGTAQRVILASKADELDAKTFGIAVGDPVLESNQLVALADGRPFDLSKTRYSYESGQIITNTAYQPQHHQAER